jgi:hypothetical protein
MSLKFKVVSTQVSSDGRSHLMSPRPLIHKKMKLEGLVLDTNVSPEVMLKMRDLFVAPKPAVTLTGSSNSMVNQLGEALALNRVTAKKGVELLYQVIAPQASKERVFCMMSEMLEYFESVATFLEDRSADFAALVRGE